MKRSFMLALLVSAFLTGIRLMAQESQYTMLKDSTIWCYLEKGTDPVRFEYYCYIVDGDTTINSKLYKKVYAFSNDYNPKTAIYREAMREQDNKVYLAGDWTDPGYDLETIDGETVLYDFSLDEGDEFAVSKQTGEQSAVGSVMYVELKDGYHRYYLIYGQYKGAWIEGIGSVFLNPFNPCHIYLANLSNNCLREFAQDGTMIYNTPNRMFANDNIQWVERESSKENEEFTLNNYSIQGDTVINHISYKKVHLNGFYQGAIRMNMEHKIYYLKNEMTKENLLYDFDWPAGKELRSGNFSGNPFILVTSEDMSKPDELKMPLFDGKEYDYRILSSNPNPDGEPFYTLNKEIRLIKDIGLTSGIFSHVETEKKNFRCYNDLVSVYDGDKLVYLNPAFKENGELASSIRTSGADRKLQVTVRNGEAIFTLPDDMQPESSRLFIFSVEGRLLAIRSLESGTISIGNLPAGMYYYRVEYGNGLPANGKFRME